MRIFGPAPLLPAERRALDAALDDAFTSLRGRTASVGPARVRAAVRWSAPEPVRFGRLEVARRLSGLSLAAVVSAFVLAGSLAPVLEGAAVTRDSGTSVGRVLNGRLAYQPAVEPHQATIRSSVGDGASNGVIARRGDTATDAEPAAGASGTLNGEPFTPGP